MLQAWLSCHDGFYDEEINMIPPFFVFGSPSPPFTAWQKENYAVQYRLKFSVRSTEYTNDSPEFFGICGFNINL